MMASLRVSAQFGTCRCINGRLDKALAADVNIVAIQALSGEMVPCVARVAAAPAVLALETKPPMTLTNKKPR